MVPTVPPQINVPTNFHVKLKFMLDFSATFRVLSK